MQKKQPTRSIRWECHICKIVGLSKDSHARKKHNWTLKHQTNYLKERHEKFPKAYAYFARIAECVGGYEYEWDEENAIKILGELTGEAS